MRNNSFRFDLQEFGGALGDLGMLLPLAAALILTNGMNATSLLVGFGAFYIVSGLYFRIPISVQPLKAVAAIAITLGLSSHVIGAAGLIIGAILLVLSLTNLISSVTRLFPKAVVKGIQLSIGIMLLKKGIDFASNDRVFTGETFRSFESSSLPIGLILAAATLLIFILFKLVFFKNGQQRFPASLAVITLGIGVGLTVGPVPTSNTWTHDSPGIIVPSAADLWTALVILVIPQLPLTLGNAVVGTCDAARTYFKNKAERVTPKALTASMGLANILAGLVGAMPMCHGSGGLTAHYRMGARTEAANIMIGSLLLTLGLLFGPTALPFLSLVPQAVLGVLLGIVGVYHASLVHDLRGRAPLLVAGTVAIVTVVSDNLAVGFSAGILLHYLFKYLSGGPLHKLSLATGEAKSETHRI